MKLLTQENRKALPPLYEQDGKMYEAVCYVKFFTPDSNWTWYATEFSPEDGIFFGMVDGFEMEMGYFSLAELEAAKGPMGLHIERDMYFKPKMLKDIDPRIMAKHNALKYDNA